MMLFKFATFRKTVRDVFIIVSLNLLEKGKIIIMTGKDLIQKKTELDFNSVMMHFFYLYLTTVLL